MNYMNQKVQEQIDRIEADDEARELERKFITALESTAFSLRQIEQTLQQIRGDLLQRGRS